MRAHAYSIGDLVDFQREYGAQLVDCRVVSRRPLEGREPEYVIKHDSESHHRCVREVTLSRGAATAAATRRGKALSVWDGEGGAGPCGPQRR
jgi:hypothetical protein